MAIAVTYLGKADSGSVTSLTVPAGATVLAVTVCDDGYPSAVKYNDGATNYDLTERVAATNRKFTSIWSLDNVAASSGSGSVAVTVSGAYGVIVWYATGLNSGGSYDTSASGTGRDTSFSSGNAGQTSTDDSLVIGGVGSSAGQPWASWTGTVDTGTQSLSTANYEATAGYAIENTSGGGVYNCAGTLSAKGYYECVVATFKAASAAGRTTKNTRPFPLGYEAGSLRHMWEEF